MDSQLITPISSRPGLTLSPRGPSILRAGELLLKITSDALTTPRYQFSLKTGVRVRLCSPHVIPSRTPKLGRCGHCGVPKTLENCYVHLVTTTARGKHRGGQSYYSYECKACKAVATARNRQNPLNKLKRKMWRVRPENLARERERYLQQAPFIKMRVNTRYRMQGGNRA
jgi:hypothetical protein